MMRILIVTHYFPPETGAPQAPVWPGRGLGRGRRRRHGPDRHAQPPDRGDPARIPRRHPAP